MHCSPKTLTSQWLISVETDSFLRKGTLDAKLQKKTKNISAIKSSKKIYM